MYGLIAGGVLGTIGMIGKAAERGRSNREMEKLIKENPQYAENPVARQRLALAQTLLNARMPGSAAAERNIYGNQANQVAGAQRNATDASQLMAVSSGIGANSNMAFQDLAQAEAQDYQRRYGNLTDAQEGVINEGDKVFDDTVRRFDDKVQFRGAQSANRAANWGDLGNFGFSMMDFGASGGFDGLFGKTNGSVIKGLQKGGITNAGLKSAPLPRSYGNYNFK